MADWAVFLGRFYCIKKLLTKPTSIQKSCTTSVYATLYNPPNSVYNMAMQAEIMIDGVFPMSMITDRVEPGKMINFE